MSRNVASLGSLATNICQYNFNCFNCESFGPLNPQILLLQIKLFRDKHFKEEIQCFLEDVQLADDTTIGELECRMVKQRGNRQLSGEEKRQFQKIVSN